MTLTLLSYNLQRGGVGREHHIAAVINAQHPDLVILQEATRPDVVQRIAKATGMSTAVSARGRSVGFLSRVPIASYRWARPRFSQHAFLEIQPEGAGVRIFGLHLSAVHAAWTEARRVRELRSLLAVVRREQCHVLVGDFNTLAPDERLDMARLPLRLRLLVWLSGGRIRWQTIAIMLGANYVDGFRVCHQTGPGHTFPTWDPHIRLDYIFLPKPFSDRLTACDVVTDHADLRLASDHLPLRIELAC